MTSKRNRVLSVLCIALIVLLQVSIVTCKGETKREPCNICGSKNSKITKYWGLVMAPDYNGKMSLRNCAQVYYMFLKWGAPSKDSCKSIQENDSVKSRCGCVE
jgi:hypothetical protein